jgi:ABC-type dipeptide/oligopeptide/nickel transport system permease component
VLNQDYIRTARAKGLREQNVILRHGFKNALLPVITVYGLQIGALLSGAVVTETVFAWPGIGRLAVSAIGGRDFPVVQGCLLVIASIFVLVNLAVDLLYAFIDPRIHYT